MSISFPEEYLEYNSTIANCKEAEFKKAQDKLYVVQTTFKKIYYFITKYRIDEVAKYKSSDSDSTQIEGLIQGLIQDLNKYIDTEINANDSDRKKITLRKLKAVLDFKYDTDNNLLTPYKEALEDNSKKIENYLSKTGGKQRTKSRKSSHRKKSRSRSRSKGRSKSKRKNKSKK